MYLLSTPARVPLRFKRQTQNAQDNLHAGAFGDTLLSRHYFKRADLSAPPPLERDAIICCDPSATHHGHSSLSLTHMQRPDLNLRILAGLTVASALWHSHSVLPLMNCSLPYGILQILLFVKGITVYHCTLFNAAHACLLSFQRGL